LSKYISCGATSAKGGNVKGMSTWKVQYTTQYGEVFEVICMRNSYAASIIRSLVKRGIDKSKIVVIGDVNEIEAYERALAIAIK
jgi:hypothetical protein